MMDDPAFVSFLIKAKLHTYPGGGALQTSSRPVSKDLHFSEGDFLYIDSYFGASGFIGEEIVWYQGVPVWGMNYYGRNLTETVSEGFGDCLKAALRNVPQEAPFRGPGYFRDNGFEYYCRWKGGVDCFTGFEEIRHWGGKIYDLKFHGGSIISR